MEITTKYRNHEVLRSTK